MKKRIKVGYNPPPENEKTPKPTRKPKGGSKGMMYITITRETPYHGKESMQEAFRITATEEVIRNRAVGDLMKAAIDQGVLGEMETELMVEFAKQVMENRDDIQNHIKGV